MFALHSTTWQTRYPQKSSKVCQLDHRYMIAIHCWKKRWLIDTLSRQNCSFNTPTIRITFNRLPRRSGISNKRLKNTSMSRHRFSPSPSLSFPSQLFFIPDNYSLQVLISSLSRSVPREHHLSSFQSHSPFFQVGPRDTRTASRRSKMFSDDQWCTGGKNGEGRRAGVEDQLGRAEDRA